MRSIFVKVICYFAYYTGIIQLFYLVNRSQRVITYHNIIPDFLFDHSLHLGFSHSENELKKHLQIINKRFNVSTQPGSSNTVMLTFDDGYCNNYCVAANVLDSFKNPAIFFVPISNVNSTKPLWIDKVMLWFSYVPQGIYTVFDLKLHITDNISRYESYESVYKAIIQDYSLKERVIDILREQYSFEKIHIEPELYKLRFTGLSNQQIDQLKETGHLIGSHGVNHDILSMLDISELKGNLETTFHSLLYNTTFISYPFGGEEEISSQVIEAFKLAGYTHAYTNIMTDNKNPFLLSRFSLPNSTNRIEIEATLSGFLPRFRNLIGKIHLN